MKKLILLFSFFSSQMLFAQPESHFSNNNLSFGLMPTLSYSSIQPSATSSNLKGSRLLGLQMQVSYMYKYDENLSFELGGGVGAMQNGFKLNFDPNKYSFLSRYNNNLTLTNNMSYFYVPAKIYYYFPYSDSRKFFANAGTNFIVFLFNNSGSRFGGVIDNGKSTDIATILFDNGESSRNYLSLGFGTEKALRRRNAVRWNLELQLGFKKITDQVSVIQPDRTFATEQFFTRGSMAKLGFAYIFSHKRASNTIQKDKFFNTQKGDIALSADLGLNGTYRILNDPQDNIKSQTDYDQISRKTSLEYFYANNRSIGLNARISDFNECIAENDGSSSCSGGGGPWSLGLSHQWYKELSKRLFWKTGVGASVSLEEKGESGGGQSGSSNASYFRHTEQSTGNFPLIDLTQSLELSLSPAIRLCLEAQYSQGLTKAYLYDFDMHLTKEAYQFQGFSRGSNFGLSLGMKANLGFLSR